jgi:tetratricopeptide (TPR) repeat protein
MERTGLNSVILVLFAVLIGVTGCASSTPSSASGSDTANLLQRAHKSYLKGVSADGQGDAEQLKQARRYAETYLDRRPDGKHVAEAWYRIGQVEFHRKNYNNVIQATDNGLDAVRQPHIRVALLVLNGKAKASAGDAEQALDAFQASKEFIESNPSAADWINAAELDYHLAGALTRTASFQRAKDVYKTLQDTYPETEYGQRARDKLSFFRTFFSVQVGLFSEENNAISMKRTLERDGVDAYILSARTDGGSRYSVRTGKYDRYEDARRMKQRLERQGIEAIVKP